MDPVPDPAAEARLLAKQAVATAKSKFGRALDYTRGSLPALDALLAKAYARFCELDEQGRLSDELILHSAKVWGSYLGEVARRTWGGEWALREGGPVLVIGELQLDPVQAALGPMTDPGCEPASVWFSKFSEQLDIRGFDPLISPSLHDSLDDFRAAIPAVRLPHLPRWALLGVLGVGLLVLFTAALIPARQAFGAWQFNRSLNRLVREGEKLSSMDGGDMEAFRLQLERVKAAYSRIEAWPYAYSLRKLKYDQAVRGWDLAVSIWSYSQLSSALAPFSVVNGAGENEAAAALLNLGSAYLGMDPEAAAGLTTQDWLGTILVEARRYFLEGRG
jgi:hypothetical protein